MTIDLCGLGAALKAHAAARNLRVSDVARLALVDALRAAGAVDAALGGDAPDATESERVKLTLRLRQVVAARLTANARDCGLSQSAYLTTLIDQVPAPPLAAASALRTSTEQLAVVSTDLSELMRVIRRDACSPSWLIDSWLRSVLDDVHRHVGIASRLMSELRPARSVRGRQAAKEGGRR